MVDPKSLIRTIFQISENFSTARQQIINDRPNFDRIKDSRITIFTNCIVVLHGIYICLIVRDEELWDDKWWTEKEKLIGKIGRPAQKDMFVGGFDSFTVTAYFNLLFIALENGFSTFYKIVCTTKGKPGDFRTVYDDILKELQLTRYYKLKILRKGRNACMHTNGVHTGGPGQLHWSGITVTYTKGEPVDYGGNVWPALIQIAQGIVDMLKEVVNSPKIIQENQIIDPSYADL